MHIRAASPEKDKVQTVVNEFLRRYKNTSRYLPKSTIEGILQDYACDLKRGGFSPKWIQKALDAASTGYARMAKSEMRGECLAGKPEKSRD